MKKWLKNLTATDVIALFALLVSAVTAASAYCSSQQQQQQERADTRKTPVIIRMGAEPSKLAF